MWRHRNIKPASVRVIALAFLLIYFGLFAFQRGWFQKLWPEHRPRILTTLDNPEKESRADAAPEPLQNTIAAVADAVMPTVVNISSVFISGENENPHEFYFGDPHDFFQRFFGQSKPPRRETSTGSGVIIDPDGYVLTNAHVVRQADALSLTLATGKSYRGEVVGIDDQTDLAVLKIKTDAPLPAASLGESATMRVGDWVMAIGSPFGLEKTLTVGIISAHRQSLRIEGHPYRDLLQTDAAINSGNSGGPLVNIHGQVIGINTAIYAPTGVFTGIGFAIPVDRAKAVLKDLIEKGKVVRGWMGVEIAEIDDVTAKHFGLPSANGALVNNVIPDTPASKAGIKRGDVILQFGGRDIESPLDLQDVVAGTPPQKKVTVKILRNKKPMDLHLTTEEKPANPGVASPEEPQKPASAEWMGATFINATEEMREEYGIPPEVPKRGIIAAAVPARSRAGEIGVTEGDLILGVNQTAVRSVADVPRFPNEDDVDRGVVLDIVREGHPLYLSFKKPR